MGIRVEAFRLSKMAADRALRGLREMENILTMKESKWADAIICVEKGIELLREIPDGEGIEPAYYADYVDVAEEEEDEEYIRKPITDYYEYGGDPELDDAQKRKYSMPAFEEFDRARRKLMAIPQRRTEQEFVMNTLKSAERSDVGFDEALDTAKMSIRLARDHRKNVLSALRETNRLITIAFEL